MLSNAEFGLSLTYSNVNHDTLHHTFSYQNRAAQPLGGLAGFGGEPAWPHAPGAFTGTVCAGFSERRGSNAALHQAGLLMYRKCMNTCRLIVKIQPKCILCCKHHMGFSPKIHMPGFESFV